jgi:5'-methylthioadenosine/S-adenosylhomocysteine nucleosidase
MKSKQQKILILTAMQQEYEAVVSNMSTHHQYEKYGISIVEGYLFEKHCVVAISGVGKVASAFTAQYLLSLYQPKFVIFTGVAGALNPEYQIGDIVIARDTVQHDMDGRGLGFPRGEVPYSGQRFFSSDEQLLDIAEKTQCAHRVHIGRVLTGDQFITNKEQTTYSYMLEELQGDAVDMEGASVAYVCKKHDTPFILVRTISDKANSEAPENFEAFLPEVAGNSLAVIQQILYNSHI